MNREHVLFHLQEAEEELARTIADMRRDPEYDFGEYDGMERPECKARAGGGPH